MKTIMPLLLVVMTNNNGIKGTHFRILYIGFWASKLRDMCRKIGFLFHDTGCLLGPGLTLSLDLCVCVQDVAKSVNEIKRDIEALNTTRDIQTTLLDYKVCMYVCMYVCCDRLAVLLLCLCVCVRVCVCVCTRVCVRVRVCTCGGWVGVACTVFE